MVQLLTEELSLTGCFQLESTETNILPVSTWSAAARGMLEPIGSPLLAVSRQIRWLCGSLAAKCHRHRAEQGCSPNAALATSTQSSVTLTKPRCQ